MTDGYSSGNGRAVVDRFAAVIHENREFLSEIDGKIGDGDHGINMDKGFRLSAERLEDGMDLSQAIMTLGRTLLLDIGGSMGPLYGRFFKAMAKACRDVPLITVSVLSEMADAGYQAVRELGGAVPGDKTLVDTLDPAVSALKAAVEAGKSFSDALDDMVSGAEQGWQSTEDMVAKIGRSSRLGERSRGVLDAGATSCYLILKSMAESMNDSGANS